VLEGKQERYSTYLSLSDMQDVLLELGCESLEDFEDNGWQWDFWETYSYLDKYFVLSGSGNRGYASLRPKED
jgi:hypothetical protein